MYHIWPKLNMLSLQITLLRKQINELQMKIADSGGGSASSSKSVSGN